MSNNLITIVDYGCGNIYSLNRILEKLDCKVQITDDPEKVSKADKLFWHCARAYEDRLTLGFVIPDKSFWEMMIEDIESE